MFRLRLKLSLEMFGHENNCLTAMWDRRSSGNCSVKKISEDIFVKLI